MPHTRQTITHFLIEEQRRLGGSGEFTTLLTDIVTACKMISAEVNRGALAGVLGSAETENIQGETQKKLDVVANDILLHVSSVGGDFAAMASEELEDIHDIPSDLPRGHYLLLFDPLDGSSNVDINVSVGTIFSILRAPDGLAKPRTEDFLQPGTRQVCAGYALYGSSTMMVLTTGRGVNGFTLDQGCGEFVLTHPGMRIPGGCAEYSINTSRARLWDPAVRRYVEECQAGKDGPRGKNFNMRWVASMVADVHRVISRGGVFLYPSDRDLANKGGKLRLMYEANPMAFLVEQAGGAASTGRQRILEVQPTNLHQRVPVLLGDAEEIERLDLYYLESDAAQAAE